MLLPIRICNDVINHRNDFSFEGNLVPKTLSVLFSCVALSYVGAYITLHPFKVIHQNLSRYPVCINLRLIFVRQTLGTVSRNVVQIVAPAACKGPQQNGHPSRRVFSTTAKCRRKNTTQVPDPYTLTQSTLQSKLSWPLHTTMIRQRRATAGPLTATTLNLGNYK